MKFTKEEVVALEVAAESREQEALVELSALELAFVGGGSGEVTLS